MSKVTIEMPNDIPLPHTYSEAAIQTARVVNAMARWFGVDVKAEVGLEKNPDGGEDRKIISFRFEGEQSGKAAENVGFFMANNPDLKCAHIATSQMDKTAGDVPVKMDLDVLSRAQSKDFDAAAYDAGHNGSIIARRTGPAGGRAQG